ncbi:MAG: tetratricopeptide repeat protein [Anaerolineae bacterium]|nr:tetratricopeptide repeat protein [Anaerolineae bacterium]
MKRLVRSYTLILVVVFILAYDLPIYAAPLKQDASPVQCRMGTALFLSGKAAEAIPLLEAGIAHREQATFANSDDLGFCALALGWLRDGKGNRSGALEAYQIALDIFQTSGNREFEGITLKNIGEIYRTQAQYSEALASYQHALAIYQELGDRTEEGVARAGIGAIYEAQGRYTEALESLQEALAITREVDDRAGEGTALSNIGVVYDAQGRYAEALESYQQALTIRREVGDRAGEGVTLTGIGGVYEVQGRYVEALDSYRQALAIFREVGDRTGEAVALVGISGVYEARGRHAEALESLQQALAIRHEVGDRAGEGVTLNNIGEIYRIQGRYAEALESYRQALTIRREVGDRAGEGVTLNNIGLLYHAQGQYAEALESLQQALAIHREGGDRAGEGAVLNNIGGIYEAQGRYAEALANYQQAFAIVREVGYRAWEGISLNNIGEIHRVQGRYAEALESFQQALVIVHEIGDRAQEGATLNNIGAVYDAQEQYTKALDNYQQALVIVRETGNRVGEGTTLSNIGGIYAAQGRYAEALENLQRALIIVREVGDRAGEGTTLHNIGVVYAGQGWVAKALASYQQAIAVFETIRATAGSEAGRTGYIAQYISTYKAVVNLLYEQGEVEAAFFTTEQGRARAFLDSLATGQVQLTDSAAAELLAQEQELYVRRQALQENLVQAQAAQPPEPEIVAALKAHLAEVDAAYAAVLAAIAGRSDELADLVLGRSQNIFGVSQVQPLLDEQTTLISYFVLKDKTLAFLISRDSFQTLVLEVSRAELDEQIRYFRDFANVDEVPPESLVTLYNWLINPLKPYLITPHLAIIPHNILHYLPFAALTDGQRYLIDDYTLTTLPSASSLSFIQQNARQTAKALTSSPTRLLVLGNPATGDFDTTASFSATRDQLGSLPYAEKEAKAIAELFGVKPLVGEDATETAVRKQASQANILHLAAHGKFNPITPLNSLIALAPDNPISEIEDPQTVDGWLTVGEVYGLDLKKTDLVVLSACETNLGDLSEGDELVGLTRAFMFAGTPSVIASLWNVEDEATSLLMERFYTHLKDGIGKAEALRQAQLEVREKDPNPYYWAAFVLSGDGG